MSMSFRERPLLYEISGRSLKISLSFGCCSINAICSLGFPLSLALMDDIVLQMAVCSLWL